MGRQKNNPSPGRVSGAFLPLLILVGCLGGGGPAATFLALMLLLVFVACRPILQKPDLANFSFRSLFQKSAGDFGSGSTCLGTQDFTNNFDLSQDLAATDDGFRIDGENSSAGVAVSSAGDIDGDGLDDVILGSGYNFGDGRAYVIFGKRSGHANITLPASAGDGFYISGSAPNNQGVSNSVTGGGDFNGDGIDDLFVNASNLDYSGRAFSGIIYVIPGRTSGFSDFFVSTLPSSDGFLIGGPNPGYYIGRDIDIGGDFNGDGIADLTINNDQYNASAGLTYVLYGKNGNTSNIDLNGLATADGFTFAGVTVNYFAGHRGSSVAGDVNGDGMSDFLIGAYGTNGYAGSIFVVYGKSGQGNLTLTGWSASDGVRIDGGAAMDYAGMGAHSAGDVNGDGFDDILIGGVAYNTGDGHAYLVFGGSNLSDLNLGSMSADQGVRFIGPAGLGDALSLSIDKAGDVNGDGFDDLILGAPNDDVNAILDAGSAYVLFGKSSGWSNIAIANLSSADGFAVRGFGNTYNSAYSAAGAGDVNGDGCADIIVGTPGAGGGNGAAHVIFGGRQE